MAAARPTAYLLLRFAASHDPPRWSDIPLRPLLPSPRTPIPSTEESLTMMWVGDAPSYSVSIRRFDQKKDSLLAEWLLLSPGLFLERSRRLTIANNTGANEKVNPGFALGIYPMQGIESRP